MRMGIAVVGVVITVTAGAVTVTTSSGAAPVSSAAVEAQGSPGERADRAAVLRKVLQLTNKRRVAHDCDRVKWNNALGKAAQRHTNKMANADSLDHQLPGEASPGRRIRRAGYDWTAWGENIAAGYRTPKAVVKAWMRSRGHRANILNCDFEHLAVGLAKTDDGTRYWTQDFGRN